MPRSLAFVVLGIVNSVIALAADDEPVRAPYVEVGDCWSYHGENLNPRARIDSYELCVTYVDKQKDVISAVATVKEDGREIDMSYSLEWAARVSITGLITAQGTKYYKFPLHIGDSYVTEFEFREALKGSNTGKTTFNMNVVGWEDITVPAGTFRALRLQGQGNIQRYDAHSTYPVKISIWYAPKVNRHVKFLFENPQARFQIGEELTGYRLNK